MSQENSKAAHQSQTYLCSYTLEILDSNPKERICTNHDISRTERTLTDMLESKELNKQIGYFAVRLCYKLNEKYRNCFAVFL